MSIRIKWRQRFPVNVPIAVQHEPAGRFLIIGSRFEGNLHEIKRQDTNQGAKATVLPIEANTNGFGVGPRNLILKQVVKLKSRPIFGISVTFLVSIKVF